VERDLIPPPATPPPASRTRDGRVWCVGRGRMVRKQMVPGPMGVLRRGTVHSRKELIPIILACNAWGPEWDRKRVTCHCDNQVIVASIRSRSSRHKGIMHLIRCLVFIEARHNCSIEATYINTRANHLADDLSRDHASQFLSKVPTANPQPSSVSQALLRLLLDPRAVTDMAPAVQRHFEAGLAPSTSTEQPQGGFYNFVPATPSPHHSR
jgi:hypothetical protein